MTPAPPCWQLGAIQWGGGQAALPGDYFGDLPDALWDLSFLMRGKGKFSWGLADGAEIWEPEMQQLVSSPLGHWHIGWESCDKQQS